jgi:hypothetical protein
MIQVDEADYDQSGSEDKISKKTEGETKFQKEGQSDPTGKGFHQGITPGDPGSAMAAFSTQEEIADQGDIIIGPDGCPATGAKRSGRNDGKILGQAINTNIQKAAHATTHPKNENQHDPKWPHGLFRLPGVTGNNFEHSSLRLHPGKNRNPSIFLSGRSKIGRRPILTIYRPRAKYQGAIFDKAVSPCR